MRDRRLIYLFACAAAYMLLWFVVPKFKALNHPAALVAMTVVFMFVQLSIVRWFTSLTPGPRWVAVVMVSSLVVWGGVVLAVSAPYARYDAKDFGSVAIRIGKAGPPPASITRTVTLMPKNPKSGEQPKKVKITATLGRSDLNFKLRVFDRYAGQSRALTSLLMIFAACAFGYLVSFVLRDANIVLPIAALAPFVDIWTVFVGPTARAIATSPHVVNAVSVAMPTPGSASTGFEPISFIGPADFIFLALFFGAIYRLKMEPVRTFWFLFPAIIVAMLAVLFSYRLPHPPKALSGGLPALVPIGLAIIVANYKHFRLKRQEYIAIGITMVLLILAFFVLTPLFLNRH